MKTNFEHVDLQSKDILTELLDEKIEKFKTTVKSYRGYITSRQAKERLKQLERAKEYYGLYKENEHMKINLEHEDLQSRTVLSIVIEKEIYDCKETIKEYSGCSLEYQAKEILVKLERAKEYYGL